MSLHVSKDIATLPNVKKMFIPDPGYMMYDVDLSGADAQVVAWEADDADLKALFRRGENVHIHNAKQVFGNSWDTALGHHKSLGTQKGRMYYDTKRAVHLTNYVGSAKTLATVLGWTILRASQFQNTWFSLHPGIRGWHDRSMDSLRTEHLVRNAFGYHRIYFGRPDDCLSEAVAWTPQSTIAINCFKGALQLEKHCPWVEILLQTHDSLTFQVPLRHCDEIEKIQAGLTIPIPYPDPLIIGWKMTRSMTSWGDCCEFKVQAKST